jgi:hypothetical protein
MGNICPSDGGEFLSDFENLKGGFAIRKAGERGRSPLRSIADCEALSFLFPSPLFPFFCLIFSCLSIRPYEALRTAKPSLSSFLFSPTLS